MLLETVAVCGCEENLELRLDIHPGRFGDFDSSGLEDVLNNFSELAR